MNNQIAIKLSGVSKKYTIHHEKPTLMERLAKGKDEEFWALNNVNLTIRKGERVGIIGSNGSGKTTLLKIIAGITTPTSGTVKTHGQVVSLIDLEAGFHPELTGEQNVYLNGLLLGMKRREIDEKLKRIIAFADIDNFIDAPLFTYSQGMKLRLGFAISVYTNPDVLILDEGLQAGDINFQTKLKKALQKIISHTLTLVVVSHNLETIRKHTQKIIWMHKGTIIKINSSHTVLKNYLHRKT
ncbi:MAG: ABC transporter ATP-binding protein [Patescibacteria group bacterium]